LGFDLCASRLSGKGKSVGQEELAAER
jgi:hypothetical protein